MIALSGIAGATSGTVEYAGLFIAGMLGVAMLVYRDRTVTPKRVLRPAA